MASILVFFLFSGQSQVFMNDTNSN